MAKEGQFGLDSITGALAEASKRAPPVELWDPPFCGNLDMRIAADGTWFLCLYAERGVDLREPLRAGASDDDLRTLITSTWTVRADRGAEERLALADRGALYQIDALRADPRREMHTRGG